MMLSMCASGRQGQAVDGREWMRTARQDVISGCRCAQMDVDAITGRAMMSARDVPAEGAGEETRPRDDRPSRGRRTSTESCRAGQQVGELLGVTESTVNSGECGRIETNLPMT